MVEKQKRSLAVGSGKRTALSCSDVALTDFVTIQAQLSCCIISIWKAATVVGTQHNINPHVILLFPVVK